MRARERKRITEKFSKRILYRERKNMSTNQERMSGVVDALSADDNSHDNIEYPQ